ncbi:MAG: hypothetical protein COW66_10275 [Flavobacteriaceae bacterium CG18_big_fil_WC_8_21_14_2_50_34_36]|nr:MAG: hypothetical protein COW66_10275 [Flavobacteriaceae bacterium CG18_big_fil_WC_8_21_14_2_50_34_36]PJC08561.1 MAG: DUF2520 domain-containing protein [Flavobacteriaceae bacterium CG_4_9_14_0_8_um_filter_34_30]
MIKVVLLGAGNVAFHLAKAFLHAKDIQIIQVYNRSEDAFKFFPDTINITTSLSEILDADCYIISISDDSIAGFSATLPFSGKLVVHTSGSVAMNPLNSKNRKGVFYPLQTFSKNTEVNFAETPVFIEAENETDLQLLQKIGRSISEKCYNITSEQREKLHLAAVFVCNFVNHLYHIGYELTTKNDIPFDLLKPLIKETARKLDDGIPSAMQTGPAKRNDKKTMAKQLEILHLQEHKEIYSLLSNAITNQYGRKKL